MLKAIKYFAIFLVVAFVAAIGFLYTLDVNKYKPEIIALVEKQTGRDFNIEGELKIVPSLVPKIGVSGVSFGNAKWGSAPEMLKVDKFEAQMAVMPLLTGEIQIQRLILNQPEILLETTSKGTGNWEVAGSSDKKEATESSSSLPALNVNEIKINQATIIYKNGKTKSVNNLFVDTISLKGKDADSPLDVLIKAKLDKLSIKADGQIGSITSLTGNKKFPVDLNLNLADVALTLKGELAKPLEAKGMNLHLLMNLSSTSKLSSITGSDVPDYGKFALDTMLSDTKSGYALNKLVLSLGENSFSGNLSAALGSRPALSGSLSTKSLNLDTLLGDGGKSSTSKSEKVFPSEPLPLQGLKSADLNLKLSADKLITSGYELTSTQATIKLNNGKLSLSPLKTSLIGGKLDGSFVLDGSNGKTASLNTNLAIKGLKPDSLPDIKQTLTGGATDATIKLSGSGKSVADIMGKANGQILVAVGKGSINNKTLNVAGADAIFGVLDMLNPSEKKDRSTLECGVIKFDIKDGIAKTDKGIALSTDKMNVVGSGEINLKTEKLDIGITPDAKGASGLSAAELAGLVRLGGTLANPSPRADTKAALKASLSAGAAVATGGLSLLAQSLLDSKGGNANPCDVALGKVTPKAAAKQEEKSTTTKAVEDVKDKAVDAVGGALKKLFGN